MKKLLLLFAVAFSMTAVAADLLPGAKFQLGTVKHSLNNIKSKKVAPRKAPAVTEIVGTYIGAAITDDPVNATGIVLIESTGSGLTVTGAFFSLPTATVQATYNNGVLTIPAGQHIYNHQTYGPASLYATDGTNLYDLVLTIQEDGSFTLDPSLQVEVILTSGQYAGYNLGDSFGTYEYQPVNGTIAFDAYDNITTPAEEDHEEYPSSVKLQHDGEGNVTGGVVYGFDDMTWLPFTVGADNQVQFSTDKVFYYSDSYELAFAVDMDDEGGFNRNVGPKGTINVTEGTITMPQWAFMLPTSGFTRYYILNTIKKNCVITFTAEDPTSIESIQGEEVKSSQATKVLRNGNLFIQHNGKRYTVAGAMLK